MAFYYLETSALVKLYVRESGTERVLALANRTSENRLAILGLTQVEFRSAVRRRERNGEIPPLVATQLLETFKRHLETRFVSQTINDFVLDVASALVDRHALRAYDAVQLAGYVALRGSTGTDVPVFVCSFRPCASRSSPAGRNLDFRSGLGTLEFYELPSAPRAGLVCGLFPVPRSFCPTLFSQDFPLSRRCL